MGQPLMEFALLVIFLVHLGAFTWLWVRRRQPYYLALIATFTLLSAATAARLLAPDLQVAATLTLGEVLRAAALAAAAVSIGWTLMRMRARWAR
ncbi:MAG: hypothetical protein R6V11_04800 [Ectothiorhodospiraceae bacterium]